MSLGLGDLKKKARSAKKKASTDAQKSKEHKAPPSFQHQWAGKTTTARPWGELPLATSRGNRRSPSSDAVMNEDWMSLHAEPLFWIDLESYSKTSAKLAAVQKRLLKIERKIQTSVVEPLNALRKFWRRG